MKLIIVATGLFCSLGMSALAAGPTAVPTPRAAPGPVLGAGLPVFAVGYGIYWLVRRRKKATQING
jgi:hypothetical protein